MISSPRKGIGIRQMKRKYPHVYKSYQQLWDKLMS